MSQKFKSEVQLEALNNATTDTDKFLVSDGGIIKYRTGSEMLSDLGVAPGVASNIQHQVKAGVAINKGQAVYVTSADGTNMIVGLASNASEATSSKTMGLMASTVSTNGFGNVIAEGLLAGLNTNGATAGDPVWLGTNGNLIYGLTNKPYAPAHLVFIGIVTRVNSNNGEIFVKVQNGFELDELHDVDLKTTTPVNGHLLGFNGTLWVNKTIAGWLGYTPANANGTTNYVPKFTGSTTLGNSLIFDNGTNVGIGTTSPAYKLHIGGVGSTLAFDTLGAPASNLIRTVSDYELSLYCGRGTSTEAIVGNDNFRVLTSASERMRITSSGNVGIGTSTPDYLLTVSGPINVGAPGANLGIILNNLISTAIPSSSIKAIIGTTNSGFGYSAGSLLIQPRTGVSAAIAFATEGSEKMRITSTGNVGIGTSSPSYKQHIVSDSSVVQFIQSTYLSSSKYYSNILIGRDIAVDQSAGLGYVYDSVTPAKSFSHITTYGKAEGSQFSVTASGNVGIGIANPGYKLHVIGRAGIGQNTNGTATIDAYSGNAYFGCDGTQITINGSTNNVGIGTTSPTSRLEVFDGDASVTTSGSFSFFNSNRNFIPNTSGVSLGAYRFRGYSTGTTYQVGSQIYSFSQDAWTSTSTPGYLSFQTTPAGSTSPSEKMIITSAGNVGIGTSSPATKLQVDGAGYSFITGYDSGNRRVYIGLDSAGEPSIQGALSNGTARQLSLNPSGGNVGIGTSSPISASGYTGFTVYNPTTGGIIQTTNGTVDLRMQISATAGFLGTFSNHDLVVSSNSTEKMRITSAGNVGIGTSSPNFPLTVDRSNSYTLGLLNYNIGTPGEYSGVTFGYTGNSYQKGAIYFISRDGAGRGNLQFALEGSNDSSNVSTSNTKMTLTYEGNVGIGTSSPSQKLDVSGVAKANSFIFNASSGGGNWQIGSDGSIDSGKGMYIYNSLGDYRISIKENGNVGIGDTAPSDKFVINGRARINGANALAFGNSSGGYAQIAVSGATTGNLLFSTYDGVASGERMRITTTGNVGIGTTDINRKFVVGGSAGNSIIAIQDANSGYGLGDGFQLQLSSASDAYVRNYENTATIFHTNDTERMRITSAGNVGIGTTIPSAKLDVSGNIAATGIVSAGGKKLSLGILDINVNNQTQVRINTTIPFASGGADFTVNIKGFAYGSEQMVSLSLGWHYYLETFWSETIISNGAWSPTVSLAKDASGFVVIYLPSPPYWSKLYVESVYSSNYQANYSSGWTWTDANISDCTDVSVLTYKPLATSITGSSGSTAAISGTTNYVSKFTTASTLGNSLIYDNGTNVGIGTISPSEKLEVSSGDISIRRNTGTWGSLRFGTNEPGYLNAWAGVESDWEGVGVNVANLKFFTSFGSRNERMRITSTGNVGIGTTSPGAKIDIVGSYDALPARILRQATYGEILRIGRNGVSESASINYPADGVLAINTSGSERMRITSSGNVGIGTTSPAAKLDVVGDGRFSARVQVQGSNGTGTTQGGLLINYNANTSSRSWLVNNDYNVYGDFAILQSTTQTGSTFTDRIYIKNDGNIGIGTSTPTNRLHVLGGILNGAVATFSGQNNDRGLVISTFNSGNSDAGVLLNAQTALGVLAFATVGSERMRITSSGNVGIGTSSPTAKLEVAGTVLTTSTLGSTAGSYAIDHPGINTWKIGVTATNSSTFHIGNDTGGSFVNKILNITAGGNVGIGTTSPNGQLDVYSSVYQRLAIKYPSTYVTKLEVGGGSYIQQDAGNEELRLAQEYGSGKITFFTGATNTERMRITSSGNVGIGTTSPGSLLAVGFQNTSSELLRLGVNYDITNAQRGAITWHDGSGITGKIWTSYDGSSKTSMFFGGLYNSTYDQGTYLTIRGDGNVGIGTTSPITKLSVATVWSNGTDTPFISSQVDSETLNRIGTHVESTSTAATAMTFYTHPANNASSEKMRITSAGNVGIGTTSPTALLDIQPASGTSVLRVARTGGTDVRVAASITSTGGLIGTYTNSPFDIYTNSTSKVRVTETGNVGIGTTSPQSKLHVSASGESVVRIQDLDGTNQFLDVGHNGGASYFLSTNNTSNGSFTWYLYNGTTFTVPMYISPSGNVGIGTTAPNEKLHVYGTSVGVNIDGTTAARTYYNRSGDYIWSTGLRSGDTKFYIYDERSASRMVIDDSGNVGIGSTSPGNKLVVDYTTNGANGIVSRNLSTGGSAYAFVGAFNNSGNGIDLRSYPSTNLAFPSTSFVSSGSGQTGGMIITQAGGNPISLWTNGSEKMRVTSGGNIGIGTSTPSTNLEVKGTDSLVSPTIRVNHDTGIVAMSMDLICDVFSAAGIIDVGANNNTIFRRGSSDSMLIDGDGYIGINTSSPNARVHVRETIEGQRAMTIQVNENPLFGAGLINFENNAGSNVGSINYDGSSTSYNTSSDYRLKENVVKIDGALDRLKLLKPVNFNFINRPDIIVDGFIAHEVQEVIPAAVVGVKDELDKDGKPKYQGIDHSKIVPLLTAALQEAIDKITQLEERINKLENK
jgi:hypothetical protein